MYVEETHICTHAQRQKKLPLNVCVFQSCIAVPHLGKLVLGRGSLWGNGTVRAELQWMGSVLHICWVTDSPAHWVSPKPERDLSKKQDRRLLRSHTWGFPVPVHTWTNTPAHREKVLISPVTERYKMRSVRQWALITQWACLLCDHPQPLEWQRLNFSSLWCFVMQPAWTDSLSLTVTVVNTLTNTLRIF